jgi:hypothetical protein
MDDDGTDELAGADPWDAGIARAVLSESERGRTIAAGLIASFGEFMSATVRPILREVAEEGGEPQLLVNGLAQMLRDVADSMEFPLGVSSSSRRPASADDGTPGDLPTDPADPS